MTTVEQPENQARNLLDNLETDLKRNETIFKTLKGVSFKTPGSMLEKETELKLIQKVAIFDYVKHYLTCTTIGFGIVILLGCLHFKYIFLDNFSFRIISTVFPAQAIALIYLVVRHFYPNNNFK